MVASKITNARSRKRNGFRACVQRVLVYGSETWPMKVLRRHVSNGENRANDGQVDVVWCKF